MEHLYKHESANWTPGQVKGFTSSKIFEKKSADLKFLRVESNSEYPLHIHPDKMEYAVIISGNPEITIGGENYVGTHGDVFIFPPQVKHSISNKTTQTCILLIGSAKTEE